MFLIMKLSKLITLELLQNLILHKIIVIILILHKRIPLAITHLLVKFPTMKIKAKESILILVKLNAKYSRKYGIVLHNVILGILNLKTMVLPLILLSRKGLILLRIIRFIFHKFKLWHNAFFTPFTSSSTSDQHWYIDTRTTHHLNFTQELLDNASNCTGDALIMLGNGTSITITHLGCT